MYTKQCMQNMYKKNVYKTMNTKECIKKMYKK